jgi:hypothetical protein
MLKITDQVPKSKQASYNYRATLSKGKYKGKKRWIDTLQAQVPRITGRPHRPGSVAVTVAD